MKLKLIIIPIIIIMIYSCYYEPWQDDLYINKATHNTKISQVPSKNKYDRFFIDDVFVNVLITPVHNVLYQSTSPYHFSIIVKSDYMYDISINKVNIESENLELNENDISDDFPVNITLKKEEYSNSTQTFTIYKNRFTSSDKFNFNSDEHKKIHIEIDLTVTKNGKSLNKIITHELKAKINKGMFKYFV